jgi:hypothetical protein
MESLPVVPKHVDVCNREWRSAIAVAMLICGLPLSPGVFIGLLLLNIALT